MKNKIYDHSWEKILEAEFEPELAKHMITLKMEQLSEVAEKIRQHAGDDAVENVLDLIHVRRALYQCLEYLDDTDSNFTQEDYYIYYEFASTRVQEAELIIDRDLPELGL